MTKSSDAISPNEMAKWGDRLAADDWLWVTWKYLILDTGLILLWLVFCLTLIQLLIPTTRRKIAVVTNINPTGGTIFSAVVFTWLAGDFAWAAIFGPGPYGYLLQSALGPELFSDVADWTNRYLTLIGFIFSGGFG